MKVVVSVVLIFFVAAGLSASSSEGASEATLRPTAASVSQHLTKATKVASPKPKESSNKLSSSAQLLEKIQSSEKNPALENQITDLIQNTLIPNVQTHHDQQASALKAAFDNLSSVTLARFTACDTAKTTCDAATAQALAELTSAKTALAAAQSALTAATTGSLAVVTFDFSSDQSGASFIAAATAYINTKVQAFAAASVAVDQATALVATDQTSLDAQAQKCSTDYLNCQCSGQTTAQTDVSAFNTLVAAAAASQIDEQADIKTFGIITCLVSSTNNGQSGQDCTNAQTDVSAYTYPTYTVPTFPSVSCNAVHHYCAVVKGLGIINAGADPRFFDLQSALNSLTTPVYGQSQLVCQIGSDGKVMQYPSDEAIKMGKGWWWDTYDIQAMHDMCSANAKCMNLAKKCSPTVVSGNWCNGNPGKWLMQYPATPADCQAIVEKNPICDKRSFFFANKNDNNCGCFPVGKQVSDCSWGPTVDPATTFYKADPQCSCAPTAVSGNWCNGNPGNWLMQYPSSAAACQAIVQSNPSCDKRSFFFADKNDNNCGCFPVGKQVSDCSWGPTADPATTYYNAGNC